MEILDKEDDLKKMGFFEGGSGNGWISKELGN